MEEPNLSPPPRKLGSYPTAIVTRVNPDEREALNAAAIAAGLSLQNYCRRLLGLPLPESTKAPYKRERKKSPRYSSPMIREGNLE